jgi:hypothetical protein
MAYNPDNKPWAVHARVRKLAEQKADEFIGPQKLLVFKAFLEQHGHTAADYQKCDCMRAYTEELCGEEEMAEQAA